MPHKNLFRVISKMKHILECSTYEELENEINKYMEYYNKERGQWNLKKMTPIEYRKHLLAS